MVVGQAIHLDSQLTALPKKPSGGTRRVPDGEGDCATDGEGIQNAPSSQKATHGPR